MIAIDTNILIAFHRQEYQHHPQALQCLTTLAEGSAPWAIPWPCIHEFIAIVTHSRIFKQPTLTADALAVIRALLQSPTVRLLAETSTYWAIAEQLIRESGIRGPRVHDARVAAICLDHGIRELWTADRDFSRFPGIKCHNPLLA